MKGSALANPPKGEPFGNPIFGEEEGEGMLEILVALVVRISGIFMALAAIKAGFFSYSNLVIGGGAAAGVWLEVVPLGIMFVISVLMVGFPLGVTQRLLPAETGDEQGEIEPLTSEKIQLLASSLFGLYFLVQSVLDGFYVWGIFLAIRHMGIQWSWTPEYTGTTIAALAEFCMALWFLFGAKGLWAMVRWARIISSEK